jgi:hypothetical protein
VTGRGRRERTEHGQASVIIIGFAIVVLLLVVVVVDSSAAYLKRQSLDTLADGAALYAADAAAEGAEVYAGGLDEGDLRLTRSAAEAAVATYLRETGSRGDHPGLTYGVRVDDTRVVVTIEAPLDLPLALPGGPERPRISATGSAVVRPDVG